MRAEAVWTVIIAVVLTAAVIAGAVLMLRTINTTTEPQAATAETEAPAVSSGTSTSTVAVRPDCPATGAGGVAMDCLGGGNADAAPSGVTVVNVWAWWCGPCREELPYFDEFSAAHPEYTVVGVHADKNPGNGAAMLEELGITLPSYQDLDNRFAGTLGLPGVIPITVVFRDEEMLTMFPRTFRSTAELEAAVAEVVGT